MYLIDHDEIKRLKLPGVTFGSIIVTDIDLDYISDRNDFHDERRLPRASDIRAGLCRVNASANSCETNVKLLMSGNLHITPSLGSQR